MINSENFIFKHNLRLNEIIGHNDTREKKVKRQEQQIVCDIILNILIKFHLESACTQNATYANN